jgi:short-subunit dehydrogenase
VLLTNVYRIEMSITTWSDHAVFNPAGAVFFTSSPAGFMAAPSSVIYSSTKAFLTNFAYSLAAELKRECSG